MNIRLYFFLFFVVDAIGVNGNVCVKANKVVTTNFCSGTNRRVSVGDFNGDGTDDFVCHDSITGINVIYYGPRKPFEPLKYVMITRWCYGVHSRFLVGDFNGDGRSDFLCDRKSDGYKWIAYANKDGRFLYGTGWKRAMKWCRHNGAELHVGDFNGDGRTDILCHDRNSGYKWISYADSNGHFIKTDWQRTFNKCNGKLLTGDFNGDGKTDILCHEKIGGRKLISLAGPHNNVFTGINWSGQSGWCTHDGSYLRIGDINGDGIDDLICKDASSVGNIWYSKNVGKPNFGRTTIRSQFCKLSEEKNFFIADVNGDNKEQFLCIKDNGYAQVGWFGNCN